MLNALDVLSNELEYQGIDGVRARCSFQYGLLSRLIELSITANSKALNLSSIGAGGCNRT